MNNDQIYPQNPDYISSDPPYAFVQYLSALSERAGGVFPYADFQIQRVESGSQRIQRALVQFRVHDREYGFYVDYRAGYGDGPCLQRVNRALADADAPGRFYELERPVTGVIYLTPAQVESLERGQSIRVRRMNDIQGWTTRQITDYLDKLQNAGLLDHLEDYRFPEIRQNILWIDLYSRLQLWKAIPELVYHFDTEMIYDPPNDYIRLIQRTALISHGVFKPENFAARVENDGYVAIEFDYERATFRGRLYINDDWVDMDYLQLLNSALSQVHGTSRGKFCIIDTGGQDVTVIFLTFEQCALAEIGELLPRLRC